MTFGYHGEPMNLVQSICCLWLFCCVLVCGQDEARVEIELQKLRHEMPSLWRYQNLAGVVAELQSSHPAIQWLKDLLEGEVTESKVVVSSEIPNEELRGFAACSRTEFEDGHLVGKIFLGPPQPDLFFNLKESNQEFYASWFQLVCEAMNLKRGRVFMKNHQALRSGKINLETYVARQINLEIGSARETYRVLEGLFSDVRSEISGGFGNGASGYPSRGLSFVEMLNNKAYQGHVIYYSKVYEEMKLRVQLQLHLEQSGRSGG